MRTTKGWTEADLEKLKRLRQQGASASRAAVALRSNKAAVRKKARELGIPFPHQNAARREREEREVAARAKAGLPPKPVL